MRKNRSKHEAKKPRLAKRALALCFALIFVCSCLLPAFANSEDGLFEEPKQQVESVAASEDEVPVPQDEQEETTPVEEKEPEKEPEQETEQKHEEANASKETPEEPASNPTEKKEDSAPSESTAPSESVSSEESTGTAPSEPASNSSASSEASGESESTSSSSAASSSASSEASSSSSASSSASSAASSTITSGDVINQGEAVYTYRFWTKEINAFDLEKINEQVKEGTSLKNAAEAVVNTVPCEVLKVANNAHLSDYSVTEPAKDGYQFKGWYTIENGTEYEFSFDQNVSFEESKIIDVFAKWEKITPAKATAKINAQSVTVEVKGVENVKELVVKQSEDTEFEAELESEIDWDAYPNADPHLFDLTLKDNVGNVIEPDSGKKATVTITGMELDTTNPVKLYHKTSYGIEDLTDSFNINADGTLTFMTDSFSPFAVVGLGASAAEQPAGGGNGNNNANSNLDTRYTEGRTVYGNNRVFLYVQVTGDTTDLVLNKDKWYTLGYVDLDNGLSLKNKDYVGYWEKTGGNSTSAYSTSGSNWDEVMDALGGTNQNAENWGANSKITRYVDNNSVALKDVTWNKSGYGLRADKGATDYDESVNGTWYGVNGDNYIAWHLDGYLNAEYFASYTINYYAVVNGANVLVKTLKYDVPVNTEVKASDFEDAELPHEGTTDTFDHHDKESIKVIKHGGDNNVINLYYTNKPAKTYPLFLFAKMSDAVMAKLNKANSDLNSDGWFTLGYIEDSGLMEPESTTPNPKYKSDQKYNTAVGKLGTEMVYRHTPNSDVNLSDITWNHSDVNGVQFGLTTANGANDYADPNNTIEINGETITKNTRTWHLDGYIENLGAIVVNYYIKGTTIKLQSSVTHLGSPNRTYKLTNDEKPNELTKDGVTYTLKDIDPVSETQQFPENDVAEINLYYEPPVGNVNVIKKVAGLFGDRSKDFKFAITGVMLSTDSNVAVKKDGVQVDKRTDFTLHHDERVTVEGLKIGDIFRVAEDKDDSADYDTTATAYDTVSAGHNKNFYYKVCIDEDTGKICLRPVAQTKVAETEKETWEVVGTDKIFADATGSIAITVQNHFDGDPDTGVLLDTLPYLIILGIAVAGGAALMLHKRKHDDE